MKIIASSYKPLNTNSIDDAFKTRTWNKVLVALYSHKDTHHRAEDRGGFRSTAPIQVRSPFPNAEHLIADRNKVGFWGKQRQTQKARFCELVWRDESWSVLTHSKTSLNRLTSSLSIRTDQHNSRSFAWNLRPRDEYIAVRPHFGLDLEDLNTNSVFFKCTSMLQLDGYF